MQPRSFYAGLAVVVCALLIVTFNATPQRHAALLEQLAPRIERAPGLSPEARDAIMRLVERARDSAGDSRYRDRRDLAVRRVTEALNARAEPTSIGLNADR